MAENYRIEMINVSKAFRGVKALQNASFNVKPGEIHALVGENGAGKSTLVKILSGAYTKDAGTILIDGQQVEITDPHHSRQLGIGIIYQEFSLAPDLTIGENIFIKHLGKNGVIHWKDLYQRADDLIKSIGFDINPRALVADLSIAYQQVVEITKELSENVRMLILDEPTAVLAPREVDNLFKILLRLKDQGVSMIYISHRLDEVFRIADRVTVLKDGSVVNTVLPSQTTPEGIISMMIGRNLSTMFPERHHTIGEEVFRVENITLGNRVKNVSFSIHAGEVLGIAGLVGSGRTETVRAIFGADQKESGHVYLKKKLLSIKSPRDSVKAGIGLVPESRKEHGIILPLSIRKNVSMASLNKVSNTGMIHDQREKSIVSQLIEKLAVRSKGIEEEVADLSGGNQQKVVLAKWINTDCQVLLLDEPTRGIDVGAKVEIYTLINKLAAEGIATLVISSEMMEIIGICDRVIVMSEGEMMGELIKPNITEENIMRLAIGKRLN